MTPRRMLLALALSITALAAPACGNRSGEGDVPPVPASSDPQGKDLVEGAVVAAEEKAGGIRTYKIVHVADYPDPIGPEYHMIAYDPKTASYQEAAKLWKQKQMTIAMDHLSVRQVHFLPRDHRVLFVEPVTPEEKAPFLRATDTQRGRSKPAN